MSWKKQWNKAVSPLKAPAKKIWGVVSKVNPGGLTMMAFNKLKQRYAGGVMPQFGGGDEYRGEAAAQLVKKNVSKQAGAGKINYTDEVYE